MDEWNIGLGFVLDMGMWMAGVYTNMDGWIALSVDLHLITVGLQALALLP